MFGIHCERFVIQPSHRYCPNQNATTQPQQISHPEKQGLKRKTHTNDTTRVDEIDDNVDSNSKRLKLSFEHNTNTKFE